MDELDVRRFVEILRRRFILILLSALLATASAFVFARLRVDQYSAEVLLRRELATSPLDVLSGGGAPVLPTDEIPSQIEFIRSRGVLSPVIADLGLQLEIPSKTAVRSLLTEGAEVDSTAPAGRYQLVRHRDEIALLDSSGEDTLRSAPPGGWLAGPGFGFRVGPLQQFTKPVPFSIRPRETAYRSLRQRLTVEQVRGTHLTRLRFASPDPVLAAEVVNRVARSYQEYRGRRAREAATRRREFLAGQIQHISDSVLAVQRVLLQYQDSASAIDPEVEAATLAAALREAEGELRILEFQERMLTEQVSILRSDTTMNRWFQTVVALGPDYREAGNQLYIRLQDLQGDRQRLTASRFGYTADSPDVETLDSLIATVKGEILTISDQALGLLRARLRENTARVSELQTEVVALPARSSVFRRLEGQLGAVQGNYEMLVEKYYEAQIAEAVEVGDVEILDPAPIPVYPDRTPLAQYVGFGLFIGLALGLGLAFLLEQLDNTVRRQGDVVAATGVEVLALIPKLRGLGNRGPAVGVMWDPKNTIGWEAFRTLRTNLHFAHSGESRIFAVTSPGIGEGKSTVAGNLSAAASLQGHRTLLIDADVRRPSLHLAYSLDRGPGLAEVLQERARLEEAIRAPDPEKLPDLRVLSAGRAEGSEVEIVGSARFGGLIQALSEDFDLILVDSPPVLAVTDAVALAPSVDGFLLVARMAQTDRDALARTAEELRRSGKSIVGVVLNAFDPGGFNYYAYYRQQYTESGWRERRKRWLKFLHR